MKKKLQDQIVEDALLREVVEDVKNEQLQQMWNKYGLYIIIGIALILTATISFESIKSWQEKKRQELSDTYSIAMSLQSQGRLDESLELYTSLTQKNSGIYDDLAKLQIANIFLEQGKKDDALAVLTTMIDNADTVEQMKKIAILKLVSYKLDDDKTPVKEISDLLAKVSDGENSDIVKELTAMLYIRENDTTKAIEEYQKIITSKSAPEILKYRALDMINLLSEK
ncbi:MAG: tetratricopeptide repeat protein [Alphaproteobacteria bacterium]|nr:tetratricopeptide repeat protein [Alphaproteobacteria bacterium]